VPFETILAQSAQAQTLLDFVGSHTEPGRNLEKFILATEDTVQREIFKRLEARVGWVIVKQPGPGSGGGEGRAVGGRRRNERMSREKTAAGKQKKDDGVGGAENSRSA